VALVLGGASAWLRPALAQNPPPPSHVMPPVIKPIQERTRIIYPKKRIEHPAGKTRDHLKRGTRQHP
jgi:hypothetical protein